MRDDTQWPACVRSPDLGPSARSGVARSAGSDRVRTRRDRLSPRSPEPLPGPSSWLRDRSRRKHAPGGRPRQARSRSSNKRNANNNAAPLYNTQ